MRERPRWRQPISASAAHARLEFDGAGITVRPWRDGQPRGIQAVPATVLSGPWLEAAYRPEYLASVLAGITGRVRLGFAEDGLAAARPVRGPADVQAAAPQMLDRPR